MGRRFFPDRLQTRTGMAMVLAVVALASVALYLPTTRYDFVWDDTWLITSNSSLIHARPAEILTRGFWAGSPEQMGGPPASYYRPLVTMSFWLNLNGSRADPWWFHRVNVLLYALAAVAVTLVLWELLHSGVWALLGGLLFATHSSHVESVAFISGRTDIMLTLFTGIAAFALLRSFRKHNRWWWLVVPPAFGCALLSKETAVLFPLLVALTPLLVGARYNRRFWLLMLATMAVAAGYFVLRTVAVTAAVPIEGRASLATFPALANDLGLYIRMFVWPFAHHAAYDPAGKPAVAAPNIVATVLFGAATVLFALKRRFLTALWGCAWTVFFLLPVTATTIGPLAAERLLFLPSAGLVAIVCSTLARLPKSRARARLVAAIGCGMVAILFGVDTLARTRIWRNDETLFTAMVREAPTGTRAYGALGDAIAERQPDSALALYEHALRLDQNDVHSHQQIAMLLRNKGDLRGAIQHLRIARKLAPNSDMVLNNLALAFRDAGEADSALTIIDRDTAMQHGGSAALHLNRANVLVAAGRTEEAQEELRRALALDSAVLWARTMLADMLRQRGRYDSAIALIKDEIRYRPSATNFSYLGDLFIGKGDTARAEESYDQALRLDPKYLTALYNLAALLAVQGKLAAALPLAERAYQLRPDLEATRKLYLQLTQHPGTSP